MRASTFFALIIAILLGLAALGGARYMGLFTKEAPVLQKVPPPPELPRVLTAKINMLEGNALNPSDVTVRTMTSAEKKDYDEHPEMYLPPVPTAVVFRVLAKNVLANQPIKTDDLEPFKPAQPLSARLGKDMQAVDVLVPRERAAGGLILLNEFVDVYLTTNIYAGEGSTAQTQTAQLARNLKVIAKRDRLLERPEALPPPGEPMSFVLEANPYRAALIEFAKDRGLLSLVPVSGADKTKQPGPPFSDPKSEEYKNEDERVAEVAQGVRTVNGSDLERIFKLRPIPVKASPIRVETLTGNSKKSVTEFPVTATSTATERPVNADQPELGYQFNSPPTSATTPAPGSPAAALLRNQPAAVLRTNPVNVNAPQNPAAPKR